MLETYSSSFQKVNAMFWRPWVSETPAMPSSPHLKARDRACSCGKSISRNDKRRMEVSETVYLRLHASPSGL